MSEGGEREDKASVFDIKKEDILELYVEEEEEEEVKEEEQPTYPWWNMEVEWNKEYMKRVPIDEVGLRKDIKRTLLHYIKYILLATIVNIIGLGVVGLVNRLGRGVVIKTTQTILLMLFTQYGLALVPLRYWYIDGLRALLEGETPQGLGEYYKEIKEGSSKIGLESVILAMVTTVGLVKVIRSHLLNNLLLNYTVILVLGVSQIMIMVRLQNSKGRVESKRKETVGMIKENKQELLIIWLVMGLVSSIGGVVMVYIPELMLTVMYLRYITGERGDIDVIRDNRVDGGSIQGR